MLIATTTSVSSAQTHFIIGGEDEDFEAMLLRPKQIKEGPDGNIYVLDSGDSFIKVYSKLGEYLRKLGGPGEGPGEFQRTDGATFGFTPDGNLFFTEFFGGHRWLTIMDLNGNLIKTLSPQLKVSYGIEAAAALSQDDFLVQISYDGGSVASKNYYLYSSRKSLVHMDSQGVILATITQAEHPDMISFIPNGATSNLPFTPLFAWVVQQDNTVVWGDGLKPHFEILNFDGSTAGMLDTTLPIPEIVTQKDLKKWCQNRKEIFESDNPSWWHKYGRVIEDYDKSLFDKPIYKDITKAPAGHFLVEGPWNTQTELRSYWLFNAQGSIVSSVSANIWNLQISTHYLLYFSRHEDGSTSSNVVTWSGSIDESLSFLEDSKISEQ